MKKYKIIIAILSVLLLAVVSFGIWAYLNPQVGDDVVHQSRIAGPRLALVNR